MTKIYKCPRCSYAKSYVIRREKRRCVRCNYEWQSHRLPLRLKASQWRSIVMTFFKSLSAQGIAEETGIERKRVLRALLYVREAMALWPFGFSFVFPLATNIHFIYLYRSAKNIRDILKIIISLSVHRAALSEEACLRNRQKSR